eukprot:3157286-Pleurochrysis_carterae.AAC.1
MGLDEKGLANWQQSKRSARPFPPLPSISSRSRSRSRSLDLSPVQSTLSSHPSSPAPSALWLSLRCGSRSRSLSPLAHWHTHPQRTNKRARAHANPAVCLRQHCADLRLLRAQCRICHARTRNRGHWLVLPRQQLQQQHVKRRREAWEKEECFG